MNKRMSRGRNRCDSSRPAARFEPGKLMLKTPKRINCVDGCPHLAMRDSGWYHHLLTRVQTGDIWGFPLVRRGGAKRRGGSITDHPAGWRFWNHPSHDRVAITLPS